MARLLQLWRGRAGHGADEAFRDLLRPHVPPLYRLAARLTGDEAAAEDLIQELLVRAFRHRDTVAALDRPRPWLARVLHRLHIDRHRREGRYVNDDDDGTEEPAAPPADGPEAAAERALTHERLQRALDALPEAQRSAVILHDVEGYGLAEIAAILEVPEGTLKSRLHRARARLRALLVAAEPEEGTV